MSITKQWLTLFMMIISLALPTQSVYAHPDSLSLTAVNCSCVVYIQNRYNLAKPWENSAKAMGSVLARNGFRKVNAPQVGAVVVMQGEFPGANRTHGHVGVIKSLTFTTTTWKFTLRQGGSATSGDTESGCKNIRSVEWGAYPKSYDNVLITYWVK